MSTELPKGWSSNYPGPGASAVRYSQPTDAGQMEISGPPLTALSADELRQWVTFLKLVIRQAERLAMKKEKESVTSVPPLMPGEYSSATSGRDAAW